jgi:Carbohydrate binding domain.
MNPDTTPLPRLARPGLALALGLLLLAAAPLARAYNAILNDNFAAGAAPWTLKLGGGASATLGTDDGWGRVLIANGGTSKSHVNLEHELQHPLVNGVTYTIAFDAKAASSKSIDVLLRDGSTVHGGTYGITVSTTPNRHTITYTHTGATTDTAELSLRIGGDTATLHIDNVVVTRQGQSSQLLSKVGGAWQFNTLSVGGQSWNAGTYDFSYAGYQYGEREEFIDIPSATQTISATSGEDITAKLNAALAALPPGGGTVVIPAGNFRIGTGVTGDAVVVSTDNTVIKGAGPGLTTLTIDPTYHSAASPGDRREAAFSHAAVTFRKPDAANWIYGNAPANAAKVSAPVALGSRTITVSDPANKLASATHVVVRQIMWPAFVQAYAYDPGSSRPYKWTNYDDDVPLFSAPKYALTYYRRIVSRDGNTLTLDIPIPHPLDPADADITVVPRSPTSFVQNSGLQDLTIVAPPEDGVANPEDSTGTSVMATGLLNGLFKDVELAGFRSLGFATTYAVNTTFLRCSALDALNCGKGGNGYGFYIRGQNLLYKNCVADNVRHGYTTAAPQTSNIVLKNCASFFYRFHSSITDGGESVDDTHLQFSHGILWDNHYAHEAGLLMINRGSLSSLAYETCGWTIVWNYENEGFNTLDAHDKDLRHNLLGVTPAMFGIVVGAHKGTGPAIRVQDGYARYPATTWGSQVTSSSLHVGPVANRVLYEHTGSPVAESIYDIQFAQRAKLLP